jgi:hypothetical protein
MAALDAYRQRQSYFFSALLVTDVVSNSSLLLVAGSDDLLNQIDYPMIEAGVFELAGVVSRKKQLLPYLTHCLKKGGGRLAAGWGRGQWSVVSGQWSVVVVSGRGEDPGGNFHFQR